MEEQRQRKMYALGRPSGTGSLNKSLLWTMGDEDTILPHWVMVRGVLEIWVLKIYKALHILKDFCYTSGSKVEEKLFFSLFWNFESQSD